MKDTVRLTGVAVVVAGSLLAAGCGGGDGGTRTGGVSPVASSQPPPATTTVPEAVPQPKVGPGGGLSSPVLNAHITFTLCLQQQGIPLSAAMGPRLSPRQQISVRKCGVYLPGGAGGGVLSAVNVLRACMKKHGAPLPPANRPFVLKIENPKVAAAVRACTSLLPSTGGTT